MEPNPVEEAWAKVQIALNERKEARRESDRAAQQEGDGPTAIEAELSVKQEAYRQALAEWWRLKEASNPRRQARPPASPRRRPNTSNRRRP